MALDTLGHDLSSVIASFAPSTEIRNIGRVLSVKDGVAILDGLSQAKMGEKIECVEKGIEAMVLNLGVTEVGVVILGDYTLISEGDTFVSTGEIMSIGVSDSIVGRIVDAAGVPQDGKGTEIPVDQKMPLEKIAARVIERQPVKTPLQTGILAIDSMVPIGRGQRELIIGDRATGKTAIAIDTIINQKTASPSVVCIYCAIGQKQSRVAQIYGKLMESGAMDYTVIVNAPAADSVAMQYIAPYAATAIAEYFLAKGKDSLIIYDDLTKHAWAYRQLSLILRRPPGREAYPGDIFYLHSRLLERSCRLSEKLGGGSITSLPIVETQFGDVSAYIPTNIISITDGQIYLVSEQFNAGFRPAIDAGISVSRVGGAAQTKAMKKVAGTLRLDLAQFKNLEAFAQFGSADLDEATKMRINRGQRIRELLKQPQYEPLPVTTEIALIYAVNNGYLDKISVKDVERFKVEFISYMQTEKGEDPKTVLDAFFATYDMKDTAQDEQT
ncbi:F0F1 ATP synthase subunit alpha [Candidatus Wirthbacteria bacterium CG2_30_54_11]|uniref:ATP synthase subunit alpha n=1 Tax=Candidatus Wirthbacteria bacterium CG2_30_54_11 TaxID=1817892 RepID=A0A1J5IU57_9BACT|nr:MAG: F0F1 ATP synthase subunit alpha [Candidatus Wirthbacteria bacterium CG2_30_54_11]